MLFRSRSHIYCLAERFCCVPPTPYGHNTAAFGPLLSSGLTTAATCTWGLCVGDWLHHNICVPCPVHWNLMWPINVEIICNDISYYFSPIIFVMYRTSPEPECTRKLKTLLFKNFYHQTHEHEKAPEFHQILLIAVFMTLECYKLRCGM